METNNSVTPEEDLSNLPFGEWTVVGFHCFAALSKKRKDRSIIWNVVCSCGKTGRVSGYNLKSGRSRGCRPCVLAKYNASRNGIPLPTDRTCRTCKKTFPCTTEYFPTDNTRTSRVKLETQCRPCYNEVNKVSGKAYRERIRAKVLSHYSDGPPKCACCGESHVEFLAIDHVGGGGRRHREKVGSHIYADIIRQGFPEGFRVLCHNCNSSIGIKGYCPHRPNDTDFHHKTAQRRKPRVTVIDHVLDSNTSNVRSCLKCREVFPDNSNYFLPCELARGCEILCRTCLRERKRGYGHDYRQRDRDAILKAYGGESPKCFCCGESHREFLEVDHIEGGGARDRRENGDTYRRLIKENFPSGFRLLCTNCNASRGRYGRCPHEESSGHKA